MKIKIIILLAVFLVFVLSVAILLFIYLTRLTRQPGTQSNITNQVNITTQLTTEVTPEKELEYTLKGYQSDNTYKDEYKIRFAAPENVKVTMDSTQSSIDLIGDAFKLTVATVYDDDTDTYYLVKPAITLTAIDNRVIYRITKPEDKLSFYYVDKHEEGRSKCGEVLYPKPTLAGNEVGCNLHGIVYNLDKTTKGYLTLNCTQKTENGVLKCDEIVKSIILKGV